jgi:hypothetical protein
VREDFICGLGRWPLATRDAHKLYEQYGFTPSQKPDRSMERHDPDVYAARKSEKLKTKFS